MFISPLDQLANIKAWNKEYGWGFTAKQLKEAETWPTYNNGALMTPVLVPYLKDPQTTFDGLWKVIEDTHDSHWRYSGIDSSTLEVVGDVSHEPGLRWEVIDFGSNRNKSPQELEQNLPAHAGVLAAAAHFPDWLKAMNGNTVPYADIPGYRLTVQGESGPYAPYVHGFSDGVVGLHACWAVYAFSGVAEPVVVGESDLGNSPLVPSDSLPLTLTINDHVYRRES